MAAKKPSTFLPGKSDLYDKLIKTRKDVERKGVAMPYTSVNGHMFSFLDKKGSLGLRLPKEMREKFLEKYDTRLCEAYGSVLKEYVLVPEKLFENTNKLKNYFEISIEYVQKLKPKSTKKIKNFKLISMSKTEGTKENPWKLKTPPGTSEYEIYEDVKDGKEILVCTVGKTILHYDAKCITDLHAMLKKHGDWMELGSADEQKPAREGTVEAWGRSEKNPAGGWYGLKKGFRGRFGMYVPPLMEELGLAELEHNARNNRMRAL